MFKRVFLTTQNVGKYTKRYYRKKAKENYRTNKKLHSEYQSLGITGTFTAFKKGKKKSKSKLI
tara:strand:- start:2193 stop:2381 length:189 start_codon:yes stop_codon:yes gene_type:complete